jgi:hypothetical protein
MPKLGKWVRLEVPASVLGLEGRSVTQLAFTLFDGQAWFDRSGKAARVNLAAGKSVEQSSIYADQNGAFSPEYAVDGNTAGFYPSIKAATTDRDQEAWWQVDLGSVQPIDDIDVWNVTDSYASYLTNFTVFVSDDPFSGTTVASASLPDGVARYDFVGTPGARTHFDINRTGRYVRVQLKGRNYLQLAEIQVWAPASAMRVNYAGGTAARATQSSFYDEFGEPGFAVNGDANSAYRADASISHTNTGAQAWWQTDLGSSRPISTIDIINRFDDAPERLQNYYVLVSDEPIASNVLSEALAQSGVSAYYVGSEVRGQLAIDVARSGRYVRVQLTGSNYLTLSELRAWSQVSTLTPLSRTAPKSSK